MRSPHSLLVRQLRRHFGADFEPPEQWKAFLEDVDAAYAESDADREMLERSLDLSSTELLNANSEMRAVLQAFPDLIFRLDSNGTILDHKAGRDTDLYGGAAAMVGKRIQSIPVAGVSEQFESALEQARAGGRVHRFEYSLQPGETSRQHYEARLIPLPDSEIIVIVRNITDRKEAEAALHQSEQQLQQSMKMEAVGRIAGGVAHDFNNLITAIGGYSELIALQLDKNDPLRPAVDDISEAAARAGALTQQLLAFSRKQIVKPKTLDPNSVVDGMERMLKRVIGEDVRLETVCEATACLRSDPGQLEQALLNLAVNARDAMPDGGQLMIETRNVELTVSSPDLPAGGPGSYIELAVTDTGCGMDEETRSKVFEPFFTTKERGQGTGLGLSMVYGMVEQCGGSIKIDSELQSGTTFTIYLPRVDEPAELPSQPVELQDSAGGTETILLVEDDDLVRDLARTVLRISGYKVLDARHGGEALLIVERYTDPIELMLTDVIMPHLNGCELYERLVKIHPEMRVLYMSGYTDNLLERHRALDALGADFMPKPFSPRQLVAKVRQQLDREVAAPALTV